MSRTTFLASVWCLAVPAVCAWCVHAAAAAEPKSDAKPAPAAAASSNVAAGENATAEARPKLAPTLLPDSARASGPGFDVASLEDRPQVGGELTLHLRSRKAATTQSKEAEVVERDVAWKAAETAIILCDMWDDHYCVSAAERVGVMAPRMNAVISAARAAGVLIVHAPSGTMGYYRDTPQRKRMQLAPAVEPPTKIERWCYLDPKSEPAMPVETEKCACDDPMPRPAVKWFSRQHPGLTVMGYDAISDDGVEVYNYFRKLGIKNVALMGVHTNMCVLGRSFGIRQQVRLGMNVVLVRDLTDAMYDPRQPPYVSHARGTELVIEHIERHWCPSIRSADLMTAR
jgi:nicotinamidase-related amidase